MSDLDPLQLALLLTKSLEALGVRYLLGGSLASAALGEPRATLDIDLVVDLEQSSLAAWIQALGEDVLVDAQWAADEVRLRGSFQLIHRPTMTRVDVFVPRWEGLHLWKWQTRRRLVLDPESGDGLDVTGPEGIVIQKLAWYRDGGEVSDRQWRDVLGVLKAQGDLLDWSQLREWAVDQGVDGLLTRAAAESGRSAGG